MGDFVKVIDEALLPYVEINSVLHGKGIQSNQQYLVDNLILKEVPYCFLQTIPNRQSALTCGCCSTSLGYYSTQLAILSGSLNRMNLLNYLYDIGPVFEGDKLLSQIIVPCDGFCGEYYCSKTCKEYHWKMRGHMQLCTGQVNENDSDQHPLIQFKIHATSTNEIFLLVGEIFARICDQADTAIAAGESIDTALIIATKCLDSYVRKLWWEAAISPEGSDPILFRNSLQEMVHDSWKILNEHLGLTAKGYDKVLNVDYMARTIGMFEQNNIGVLRSNPLNEMLNSTSIFNNPQATEYITHHLELIASKLNDDNDEYSDIEDDDDADADNEGMEIDDSANKVVAIIAGGHPWLPPRIIEIMNNYGIDSVFPPLDGTAFYLTLCKINHSCDPNVIVKYTEGGSGPLVAELYALKTVNPGDELVQSYINQFQSVNERQKSLEDYGFICRCMVCVKEFQSS